MKYDAVLFDFDGVLADTEPLHFQAWRDTLEPAGVTLTWDVYVSSCIGLADKEMVEMMGRQSTPAKALSELWPLYALKQKLFQNLTSGARLIQTETVLALASLSDYRLAVVTSSARSEIVSILKKENILHLFEVAVYGEDVSRLKPDPEPYLIACAKLGSSNALVFEDSASGMASARAAGCDVVQVAHPSDLPDLIRLHLPSSR